MVGKMRVFQVWNDCGFADIRYYAETSALGARS